ncbi:MAG: hypothetical protein K0U41_08505, partial [Gammaproteobacteria bacterium]|nr:hypothetical protein [Gammaproteobacteria bacterium]
MKIETQKGWDKKTDANGAIFYRKRGVKNGTIDICLTPNGWVGSFLPTSNKETPYCDGKAFQDTYIGIIDCKSAIAKWHSNKYTRTYYLSLRQMIRAGGKKKKVR